MQLEFEFLSLFSDEVFRCFLLAFASIAFTVWILTLITDNHSFMDKLWGLLPIFYAFGFLYTAVYKSNNTASDSSLLRLKLMTFLITLWGLRLAYTFYRRGYYKWDFEDHRWIRIKKRFNYPEKKLGFHIYNFVFMAIVQNTILIGYALPMWRIQTHPQDNLNLLDLVFTILFIIFFIIEAVADEQQYSFQTQKYEWINEQKSEGPKSSKSKFSQDQIEDFKRGFLVKGLFSYSRHPNYFGDIFLWWCIYAFSLSAQYSNLTSMFSLFNYSMLSALLMSYLFQLSVAVTEKISAGKYPEYSYYQSKIGRILPSSLTPYAPKMN